jgi:hypothetical protein
MVGRHYVGNKSHPTLLEIIVEAKVSEFCLMWWINDWDVRVSGKPSTSDNVDLQLYWKRMNKYFNCRISKKYIRDKECIILRQKRPRSQIWICRSQPQGISRDVKKFQKFIIHALVNPPIHRSKTQMVASFF